MRAVTVNRAHVIPQPYGAMLDYGINEGHDVEGWTLVVDAGGGTLDWFFCSNQEGNWNRSGAHPKAMLECAYAVCDAIDKRLRDNFNVVTRIDHAIRGASATFKCSGKEYKIEDFSQEIDRVLNESLGKMMQSVGDTHDIDLILVAGGGGAVFARAMAARYPELANQIKEYTAEPVFSNVRGFQAYGEMFAGAP
jgi:plasmid segregation protein ParM